MGVNADRLTAMVDEKDPFQHTVEELAPLQRAAIAERFEEKRAAIPALAQRARELGLERVEAVGDIVPVLFSHTTYKNYPESLVDKGQWRYMNKWVATLTAVPGAEDADVSGVGDVDEWLAAMHRAGHHLNATSGTTGKCSFLDQSARDFERPALVPGIRWKSGVEPNADRPFYGLISSTGFNMFYRSFNLIADAYGRPGDIHFLTDEPAKVADINRMSRLRKAMVAGTITPSEIEAMERDAAERSREMADRFEAMAEAILKRRDEPIVLMGLAAQHWALANAIRARGVTKDALHPDSLVGPSIRRNLKGNEYPADFADQIFEIYGVPESKSLAGYGMSEVSTRMQLCEGGRYHIPPWQPLVLVDRDVTRAIDMTPDSGIVEGRGAFFDVLAEARWGALLTGDKLQIDTASHCTCGRPGPTILDTIERFKDVNDDKLSCSGSVNSYIRGVLAND